MRPRLLTFACYRDLNVTEDDLVEAHELAVKWTLDDIRPLMQKVLTIHEHDPNFPLSIIDRIKAFLGEFTTLPMFTDSWSGDGQL